MGLFHDLQRPLLGIYSTFLNNCRGFSRRSSRCRQGNLLPLTYARRRLSPAKRLNKKFPLFSAAFRGLTPALACSSPGSGSEVMCLPHAYQPVSRKSLEAFAFLLLLLWTLSSVLRATLCAISNTSGVERTANNVITYTWQVFYTTATHQHDAVLLKVVTLSWDVGVHFLLVGQTNTGNFSQCRIRLFRSGCVDTHAYTTTLWT